MKILLLNTVVNLGNIGEKVDVKSGYARNFLLKNGQAIIASKENISSLQSHFFSLEEELVNLQLVAKARADQIHALGSVTITAKAGKEGKLFGSIGSRDIAHAITIAGVKVEKNEIRLKHGALRTTGSHLINIKVHQKIIIELKVLIIANASLRSIR